MTRMENSLDFIRRHHTVNWHEHVYFKDERKEEMDEAKFHRLIEHAELTGMDMLVISRPVGGGKHITPELMRHCNDLVAKAAAMYPDKVRGMAYIDPIHGQNAIQEIERCVKEYGFVGIKLYNQFTMDDDMQNPIIEKCIELDIPILMHACHLTLVPNPQPNSSDGQHFVRTAEKYPEACIIMAHIGGGGDWNWELRGMERCPNIFTDISGSVYDEDMIEETVRVMGADRVLFGTDGSYASGLGKLTGARISDADKATILRGTRFEKYLERR